MIWNYQRFKKETMLNTKKKNVLIGWFMSEQWLWKTVVPMPSFEGWKEV